MPILPLLVLSSFALVVGLLMMQAQ